MCLTPSGAVDPQLAHTHVHTHPLTHSLSLTHTHTHSHSLTCCPRPLARLCCDNSDARQELCARSSSCSQRSVQQVAHSFAECFQLHLCLGMLCACVRVCVCILVYDRERALGCPAVCGVDAPAAAAAAASVHMYCFCTHAHCRRADAFFSLFGALTFCGCATTAAMTRMRGFLRFGQQMHVCVRMCMSAPLCAFVS